MDQQLLSQVTSAALVIYGLQALKRWAAVPAVTQASRGLNRVLGVAGAGLSALGVHLAFTTGSAEAGTYVITVTGLTAGNILHGLWYWANQWALQQLAYDATTGPSKGAQP